MSYLVFLLYLLYVINLLTIIESGTSQAWKNKDDETRARRAESCGSDHAYSHNNMCCLSCGPGTYVKSPCTRPWQIGDCEACAFDTYTESANGLNRCLSCTKCRTDQETVMNCTSTRDYKCQCKQGFYCQPDQVCEVCKSCAKCKEDEEVLVKCTIQSNTVCRKIPHTSTSRSTGLKAAVAVAVILTVCVTGFFCVLCCKCRSSEGTMPCSSPWLMMKICVESDGGVEARQNSLNSEVNLQSFIPPSQVVDTQVPASHEEEDEDKGLGQSLANTANSSPASQHLLSRAALPSYCQLPGPEPPMLAAALECEKPRRLLPLNGDESLKKSFDLFEEVDVHYHNRFFRYIGLSDNAIRNYDFLSNDDKVYELLKTWMEKCGTNADFNLLIEALLYLGQRLSAENIISKAISNGYFKYEED